MLKMAKERKYVDDLPTFKQLKVPNRPVKFLSTNELERLIECSSIWLRPILIVLRNTGMRMGEVLNLKLCDIDLEDRVLLARSTKTNNFRLIPINMELLDTLKWLLENYMNPCNMNTEKRHHSKDSYLLSHSNRARIKSIKTSFNNACKRAGLRATIHTLRHSFASHLVMNGVDLVSVKELLGHTSVKPTSLSFMKACSNLEVEQVFTRYNNPKGNADTERMIRTMKEELFWLREWENETELSLEFNKWVDYYNRSYLHSAHGYQTPIQAEVEYYRNHNSHKNAA